MKACSAQIISFRLRGLIYTAKMGANKGRLGHLIGNFALAGQSFEHGRYRFPFFFLFSRRTIIAERRCRASLNGRLIK